MAGKLYYNDNGIITELGEIQATFNMSFVLDGTKDSCKVQVLSFQREILNPNTICYLEELDSWWIVDNDKTERHANESGYFYVHNLQLVGAIELLNSRDLTDCAFYQNRYTTLDFVQRLVSLSSFEYAVTFDFQENIDEDKVVDYIKTYENYTLLSALRDFFNGYNCDIKMSFNVYMGHIVNAIINVHSKTGDVNEEVIDITSFKDVRETRSINRNSFGTTVMSNVDNATASKMQVYPVFGGMPLMSDSFQLDTQNAYVKLPSNLNDIEWIKMYVKGSVRLYQVAAGQERTELAGSFFNFDNTNINKLLNDIASFIHNNYSVLDSNWENQKDTIKTYMQEIGVATLKKGVVVNAYTGNYENPQSLLIPNIHTLQKEVHLFIAEKEVKTSYQYSYEVIGYERGSNKIDIDFFNHLGNNDIKYFTNANSSYDCGYYEKNVFIGNVDNSSIYVSVNTDLTLPSNYRFAVKYEPMGDLKLKVDNDLETNDMQIYNQNGKLTDGNAFTKILNSYSKEITSDNITRYCQYYYNYLELPRVGHIVNNNGVLYVINNVSYNFYLNEKGSDSDLPYMIDTEITMSKQIAVKSLMVNPNSNIRDYGIPQKYTVKRKQLYRDYCEFNFNSDLTNNNCYLTIKNVLNVSFAATDKELVKATAEIIFSNGNNYYYQLDTTRYIFKKLLVTMVDFQDNNIIGNDMQNQFSGFEISRIFTPWSMVNLTNTPIQYTDNNGCFERISLDFFTQEQYNTGIDDYLTDNNAEEYKYQLTSRCFISDYIYEYLDESGYSMKILDNEYKKDPLEIPVFEHTFQIGDTPEVIVGSDIFNQTIPSNVNLYVFEFVDKNHINENNALIYANKEIVRDSVGLIIRGFNYENAAKLEFYEIDEKQYALDISLYNNFNSLTSGLFSNPLSSIDKTKDLAIYRYQYNVVKDETTKTLFAVIKLNNQAQTINNYTLRLYCHQWKLNK